MLRQPRFTQRYGDVVPDDEAALAAAIVRLATRFGRCANRRVSALLRVDGRQVNRKRVERNCHARPQGAAPPTQRELPLNHLWAYQIGLVAQWPHDRLIVIGQRWEPVEDLPVCPQSPWHASAVVPPSAYFVAQLHSSRFAKSSAAGHSPSLPAILLAIRSSSRRWALSSPIAIPIPLRWIGEECADSICDHLSDLMHA